VFKNIFGSFIGVIAAGVLIFPVTVCLGLLFPIVSRCFAKSEENVGQSIGQIYSANTIGCILGSLVCGFVFIPLLGSTGTVLVFAGINLLLGIVLFLTDLQRLRRTMGLAVVVGGITCTIMAAIFIKDPFYQIIKQRVHNTFGDHGVIYLHKENVAATITAFGSETNPLSRHLWLNGVGMTTLLTEAKMMAHLPILISEDPKDVLIICFGMGTTLRSAVVHENLAIDVVELVPDTYDAFKFYHRDGPEILQNPRVHHYVDDGRNFLLMRDKLYNVITIDPAPPINSAGTVNLYSQEFISLCKKHLTLNGTLCLWVPPEKYTEVRMIMRTFQSVFPHASLWRGPGFPGFYLIGTQETLSLPLDRFRKAFKNEKFLHDINEWNNSVASGDDMANLLLLNETEVAECLKDVPIITDNYPYTEFPLWRSLLDPHARWLYSAIDVLKWKEMRKAQSN
jgi:spermidine synthase